MATSVEHQRKLIQVYALSASLWLVLLLADRLFFAARLGVPSTTTTTTTSSAASAASKFKFKFDGPLRSTQLSLQDAAAATGAGAGASGSGGAASGNNINEKERRRRRPSLLPPLLKDAMGRGGGEEHRHLMNGTIAASSIKDPTVRNWWSNDGDEEEEEEAGGDDGSSRSPQSRSRSDSGSSSSSSSSPSDSEECSCTTSVDAASHIAGVSAAADDGYGGSDAAAAAAAIVDDIRRCCRRCIHTTHKMGVNVGRNIVKLSGYRHLVDRTTPGRAYRRSQNYLAGRFGNYNGGGNDNDDDDDKGGDNDEYAGPSCYDPVVDVPVASAAAGSGAEGSAQAPQTETAAADFRDVILLRNIYDSLVSGYLYHRSGRECWLDGNGRPKTKGDAVTTTSSAATTATETATATGGRSYSPPEMSISPWKTNWTQFLEFSPPPPLRQSGRRQRQRQRQRRSLRDSGFGGDSGIGGDGEGICRHLAESSERDGMRAYVDWAFHAYYGDILTRWAAAAAASTAKEGIRGKTMVVCYEDLVGRGTSDGDGSGMGRDVEVLDSIVNFWFNGTRWKDHRSGGRVVKTDTDHAVATKESASTRRRLRSVIRELDDEVFFGEIAWLHGILPCK